MKKKLYIQPNTDFVRMAQGESIMRDLAGSGGMSEVGTAPARMGDNAGPVKHLDIRYI